MAMMIAAFSGKNRDFKGYLEEQRTAGLFQAVRGLRRAAEELQDALSVNSMSYTNGKLQVWLQDVQALEQIPGTTTINEMQDTSYFLYRLSREWQGVEFIAYAKAHEVQPVLTGSEIISKLIQEVAGNED